MQIVLPELNAPVTLTLDPDRGVSDDEYWAFCEANPDLRVERTAHGEIVIVPPAGGESDYQTLEVGGELRAWAKRTGRGKAFGSSTAFLLPDRSALSPDAAWVSDLRMAPLSKEERRKF